MLPAVVIDAGPVVGAEVFADADIEGRAVLLRTGRDQHWGTPRYGDGDHPYLTADGAQLLDDLPPTGARFTAVPPAISGLATFPVRAFAVVP